MRNAIDFSANTRVKVRVLAPPQCNSFVGVMSNALECISPQKSSSNRQLVYHSTGQMLFIHAHSQTINFVTVIGRMYLLYDSFGKKPRIKSDKWVTSEYKII